jgi:hypothetical protein
MLYGASHQVRLLADDLHAGDRDAAGRARARESSAGVDVRRSGRGHEKGRAARPFAGLAAGLSAALHRPLRLHGRPAR